MIQGWCPSPAPDCLGSPGTLGGPAGCVLHVERSGAAQRRDADHPRDQRPVRPDWQPDVPGGNVLFEAVPSNPIDGGEFLSDARHPAVASTSARWTRPGTSSSPGKTSTPLPWTDGSRRGELRREYGDGPRGQRPRSRGPARPGFLRPGRPVHDPDSRNCRHRAAGDHSVRIRGTKDRLRNQPGGTVARPAPTAAGRAARRGRSDLQIVFDLATWLGLGAAFWEGDIEAAFRHQLAPSGITLEELRAHPEGVRAPLVTRYRKYAGIGFATPSRTVEPYSAALAAHGYSPQPAFEEPLTSPRSRVLCRAAGRTSCPATGQGAGRASREWVRPEPRRSRG